MTLKSGCIPMETNTVNFDSVGRALGRKLDRDHEVRERLRHTPIVFDGDGSIARPTGVQLAGLGAEQFVLTDPKEYVASSIDSQCTSEEVGRLKVDVGAEQLRAAGARVTSFARDIGSVPEGVIGRDAIVITTVDNRRADIISNRRAGRMGARMIKANVEPKLGVVSVRAYDFRHKSALCVECQFGAHHYASQRHPRSCDGAVDVGAGGRRTNSPRWLSQIAAYVAAFAAIDLAADDFAADDWIGHEKQYCHTSGAVTSSRLQANPNCRRDHDDRWPNLVRLEEEPSAISMRELFWAAKIDVDARAKIRLCQQVALRARCLNCRADVPIVRWIADSQAPLVPCQSCGSSLQAIPFSVFSEISIEPLFAVLDQPLSEWGVERCAVIEISRGERRISFVVGGL
jgi:hypothetical protein